MNNKTSIMASVAVVALAVAAAGSWIWWKANTPNAKARELVRQQLKQPSLVRFESMRQNPDSKAVCGLLKMRDSSGQYVRRGSFVVKQNGQVWLEPADSTNTSLARTEPTEALPMSAYSALLAEQCPAFKHQIGM